MKPSQVLHFMEMNQLPAEMTECGKENQIQDTHNVMVSGSYQSKYMPACIRRCLIVLCLHTFLI